MVANRSLIFVLVIGLILVVPGICQMGGGLGGGFGVGFGGGGGGNNGMNRGSNGGGPNGGRPGMLPGPLGDQNDGGDDSGDQLGGGLSDMLGSMPAQNDDDSDTFQNFLSKALKELGGDFGQAISDICKNLLCKYKGL
ncbi:hypothetical protein CDAR_309141 [Caerostris darwini]|uniref:Uncharacterized protein n=1 Tax=Caerostris darwini TaxID=1538125 RepID=A0AAV4S946_9ARAC|nr:hypothetical protein CDAR_309141 [Caerostris darwini]